MIPKGDWLKIFAWPNAAPDSNQQQCSLQLILLHPLTDSCHCIYAALSRHY